MELALKSEVFYEIRKFLSLYFFREELEELLAYGNVFNADNCILPAILLIIPAAYIYIF